ncbi:MAG: hypothetical protein M2R45_03449 [Verrucomicrobia subdivision 3 bacterium]|nr:hypothetical protein [Limisphaerales bacterium]MCS1415733.1 hypothetical protein [Limisphaerales bacterium]
MATLYLLKNVGTNEEPAFEKPKNIRSQGEILNLGLHPWAPAVADIDADGQEEFIIGNEDGRLTIYQREDLDIAIQRPASAPIKRERLTTEAERSGKQEWRPMLKYLADMPSAGAHPARHLFLFPGEDRPKIPRPPPFGHWDITYCIIDVLPTLRNHAKHQPPNNLANQ